MCSQPPSSLIRKVLALVVLSFLWPTPYRVLWRWGRRLIVQIDFSVTFDRVNHQGILFKLCSVGVGGSVLSVLTQFLSNRSLYIVVDGFLSKLINVVSGVPQGGVLGPQLFLLYTAELFSIVENKLFGYAHDSTLVAVVLVPSPGERVAVSESMNRDLNRVSVWCNLWGMKLNASSMIVSRSRTVHLQLINPIDSR